MPADMHRATGGSRWEFPGVAYGSPGTGAGTSLYCLGDVCAGAKNAVRHTPPLLSAMSCTSPARIAGYAHRKVGKTLIPAQGGH